LLAALQNNIEMVHTLLELKGDIHQNGLFYKLDRKLGTNSTNYHYLSSPADLSLFTGVIVAGNFEMVRLLIELKANVNIQFKSKLSGLPPSDNSQNSVELLLTPLFVAAESNQLEICKLLIEHKAHLNGSGRDQDSINISTLPIYAASQLQHTELVRLLLECATSEDKQTISIGTKYLNS